MKRFNIRCYAIIINDNKEILLSDEFRFGQSFTKFIGGGLEFGEGTKDCLQREIKDETGLDAVIGDLFYVNDFYQESAFNPKDQIISFYYFVDEIDFESIPVSTNDNPLSQNGEKFRWKKLSKLSEDDVTFPIDKVVVGLLKKIN